MRKPILLLLIMLFLTSCSNASTPDSQAFPDAAELPTLPPSTGTSTAILETSVTLPVPWYRTDTGPAHVLLYPATDTTAEHLSARILNTDGDPARGRV